MTARRLVALAGLALVLTGPALPALAATGAPSGAREGGAVIDHAQPVDGAVELLVSVPAGAAPDLDGVEVSVGGDRVDATAAPASRNGQVRRTAVLAIDTSLSMSGARIAAAESAARAYLDVVPADVRVGLVTFDRSVRTVLEPSRDRAAARDALTDLRLQRETALYDGVRGAIAATGPADAGQRSVLLLSDGEDSTGSPLSETLREVADSGVLLDVVALQQSGPGAMPLQLLAQQGRGRVLDAAEPDALTATFEAQAQALARQVVVTAELPDDLRGELGDGASSDVSVSLPTADGVLEAAAYVPVVAGADESADAVRTAERQQDAIDRARAVVAVPAAGQLSDLVGLAGVGAVGVGLLAVVVALGLAPRATDQGARLQAQLQAYGVVGAPVASGRPTGGPRDGASLGDQARGVAAKALEGQAGLEARIAGRLEGAGLKLTPAEWLLVHAGAALAAATLGLLLGRGSLLMLLLGLVGGLVGPWVYLVLKQARRFKAFAEALPDTLQLVSGSLSAGLSLAQSIDTVVREGGEPIAGEFRRAVVESRLGVPFEDALGGIAERMDSKDFAWVVMAIRIQREVGGNLAELLLGVAATLREREYLRRHVRALSAEGRLSAWVLGALPPGFMAYLAVSNPGYVTPLFTTTLGIVMLVGAGLLMGVGIVWMVKAGKVEL